MAPRGNSRGSGGKKKSEDLSVKVVIGPCRMSFPHFFEPQETDNGDRYQANFLFPPNWTKQPDYKKFMNALDDCMEDKFGPPDDWPSGRNDRGPDEVVRKAEEKDYEGYKKGWYFIKAASRDPVGIVDANREEVTNPREIYGGRWCRISVTVKAYDNKSKGVGVYLNSVQVLDHDEPFGGRGPAKNDFEDWEGDALSEDDRGTGRGNARPKDDDADDRGSRRGRDRDDRDDDRGSSRRRDRDDRDDDADDRRGRRSRDDADDKPRGRGRDRDDDADDRRSSRRGDDEAPRSRNRDDDDRDNRRGRNRDDDDRGDDRRRGRDDDDRGRDDDRRNSRRSRDDEDDDRGARRGSARNDRDRDADDDRPSRGRSSRDRDDDAAGDDDRPSRRNSSRSRDDDGWN